MARFHPISFNAQRDTVASAIPGMLRTPTKLHGLLREPTGEAAAAITRDPELETRGTAAAMEWSSERAARSHLQDLLESQDSERLAEITSPDRPELVPDLKLESSREQPLTGNQTVSFQQTARSVPIFGTRATVEIDETTHKLIAVDGSLTDVPDIPAIAELSPFAAAEELAKLGDIDASAIMPAEAPPLNYYLEGAEGDQEGRWRLVYVFRSVPMAPPAEADDLSDPPAMHCCGSALPSSTPEYDYLVDANNGDIVFFYSTVAHLDIPIPCTGDDADGTARDFYGRLDGPNGVQMVDPLRNITTYDHSFGDIDAGIPFPSAPVRNGTAHFGNSAPAAVSAHCFATQVFDFFNHVLKRQGVDDKGMKLESVVNCYSSSGNPDPHPVWRNAAWWKNRMWYGQMPGTNGGGHVSTARFFDVIAHELTHGITQYTAGLVYRNQSGALNESFSDIFGVVVKNWYPGEPNPTGTWAWTIGSEWDGPGTSLRNMEDPANGHPVWPGGRGQPAHMNDFVRTTHNSGGVHINSGIHNKAAYNVLTAVDAGGRLVFTPNEVAILYYLTLTRLGALATFSDCRRTLLNVATTYYSSSALQSQKLQAIAQAYDAVGIV